MSARHKTIRLTILDHKTIRICRGIMALTNSDSIEKDHFVSNTITFTLQLWKTIRSLRCLLKSFTVAFIYNLWKKQQGNNRVLAKFLCEGNNATLIGVPGGYRRLYNGCNAVVTIQKEHCNTCIPPILSSSSSSLVSVIRCPVTRVLTMLVMKHGVWRDQV